MKARERLRPSGSIFVLDFGSQYSQLIARRVREHEVYCEILPYQTTLEEIGKWAPRGIILSGGPASVYDPGAPRCDEGIFQADTPVLGICYGMQLGCRALGGSVSPAPAREYGRSRCRKVGESDLLAGLPEEFVVWNSHGDQVSAVGGDFAVLAASDNCSHAAVKHRSRPFYGVQFHPEVSHTPLGRDILGNFLFRVCHCEANWTAAGFVAQAVEELRETIGSGGVLSAVSGGVDSTVVAGLLEKAAGRQLHSIFVDNGLLRKGEAEEVRKALGELLSRPLVFVDASDRFLSELRGVTDPEEKRRRIGRTFIEVFEAQARKLQGIEFLAQGTLYPDVIESTASGQSPWGGPSDRIKTHHNVGGLPEKLGLRLVEPLRYLFKDEVRRIGAELDLPKRILQRQPFPGPGLAVRLVGEITRESLEVLRQADSIVTEEIGKSGLASSLWQYFAVLLPVKTVGVMGDQRTYESVLAVRAVESQDGMTADWAKLPPDLLERLSTRIINEVRGINRVVYDVSSKPPGTIEWE